MIRGANTGVLAALLSALLFGAGTPLAKLLLDDVGPWLLAGLLYLGAGSGLLLYRQVRRAPRVRLARGEAPWLAGAILAGGVLGPVLLMLGLAKMPASGASLLLNAEGVFTALLAWFVFKENFDRRIALGMLAIVAGALVLSWPGDAQFGNLWPALAVLGACLSWGIDNNLTRKVSLADASWVAMVKGLAAGSVNLVIALALGASLPPAACRHAGRVGRAGLLRLWHQPDAVCRGTAPSGHCAHRRVLLGGAVLRRLAGGRLARRTRNAGTSARRYADGDRGMAAPERAARTLPSS